MMESIGEGLKKIILAGIGTAAVTAEKSKELLDDMVKKGELTVEQGKVLNQELKHNIKESVEKATGEKEAADQATRTPTAQADLDLDTLLDKLTPDQLATLKEKLSVQPSSEENDE